MQRVITPRGKIAVDSNQVLNTAHLAGQHDFIGAQSELLCELCAFERRRYQRFTCDDRGVFRLRAPRIVVHHARDQLRVETSPVDADAYRFAKTAGELNHRCELLIALGTAADIARVNTQFRQRLCTRRMLGEQPMTVEMKITDNRNLNALCRQPVANMGHRRRCFGCIDRNAYQLRAGAR